MFRDMVRIRQALPPDECRSILETALRGVLSVAGDDGYPYGVPINHWYCPEDGSLYFHSGPGGHKLDALARCDKASFCVLDEGRHREGDWALTFRSVIVFGRLRMVEDHERALEISRQLSRKFSLSEEEIEEEVRRAGGRVVCFALVPEHITGKTVHEA